MILSYEERSLSIDPDAWVAEDTTVCGDVVIGAGSWIMHGARLVAEADGSIRIGRNSIVFENAVVRATSRHDCSMGDHCIVGPNSHVVGAQIGAEVFVAAEAAVFHGVQIGHGSEVRVNGTVHLRTRWKWARPCRSDGWLSVIQRKSCRPISTKKFGKFRSHWIFLASSMASIEPRPT